MFTVAQLKLKQPEKDLGKWNFVSLPREGDYLALRLNDKPAAFLVEGVIHTPVVWPAIDKSKVEVPSVAVIISLAGPELQIGNNVSS